MARHRVRRTWWLGGALALLFACGDALRQDELDCEEAVAHLEACCPNFPSSRISCDYHPGCEPVDPDISIAESQCVRQKSCSELVRAGICQRFESTTAEYPPPRCP